MRHAGYAGEGGVDGATEDFGREVRLEGDQWVLVREGSKLGWYANCWSVVEVGVRTGRCRTQEDQGINVKV
jgi:hypothetical protein